MRLSAVENTDETFYRYGRWIEDDGREPWLWLSDIKYSTYEQARGEADHAESIWGRRTVKYDVYICRTQTTIARI